MTKDTYRIFVINTGSTSTKVALYENTTEIQRKELFVPQEELANSRTAIDQLDYRTRVVREFMKEAGIDIHSIDIIAARGGPIVPCEGGAYAVNDLMIDVLTYEPFSPHESALSCIIGRNLVEGTDIPVIIYDSVVTLEYQLLATISGLPEVKNISRGHPLNARKTGREVAKKLGKPFEECRLVVAHFGGSISISAFKGGRLVDMSHAFNGPMSPQRAGRISTEDMIEMCYSGKYTQKEMYKHLNGKAGFVAYFGTQNAKDVMAMVENGDEKAKTIVDAMAYQCAKGIAEMCVAVGGNVDAIVYTGGMAYSKTFTDMVSEKVSFLAPIEIYPGENEMESLALGGLRVLRGEEKAKTFVKVVNE